MRFNFIGSVDLLLEVVLLDLVHEEVVLVDVSGRASEWRLLGVVLPGVHPMSLQNAKDIAMGYLPEAGSLENKSG